MLVLTNAEVCTAAALLYREIGWDPLPLHEATKVPRVKWAGGHGATPQQLRGYWQRWPEAGVGLVTETSGLAVIDVDPRSGGTETLAALEAEVGVLPGTVVQHTGGGGVHLVYAHPGHYLKSAANLLGPGLDVKASGAIIVAAPTRHRSGRTYGWAGGVLAPLAPWPGEQLRPALDRLNPPAAPPRPLVVTELRAASAYGWRALEGEVQRVLDTREGGRNDALHKAACRLGQLAAEGVLEHADVEQALTLAGEATGLDTLAVRLTVASGLDWGTSHPRRAAA